jgi:hypothetical protein
MTSKYIVNKMRRVRTCRKKTYCCGKEKKRYIAARMMKKKKKAGIRILG